MTKVFQTIFNSGTEKKDVPGNCLQACVASLLDLSLDIVPHFVALGDDKWYQVYDNFWLTNGYEFERQIYNPRRFGYFGECKMDSIKEMEGINGYFKACVYSPKYSTPEVVCNGVICQPVHAVIIDKNFNIVHDPNPNYQDIMRYPYYDLLGFNGIISIDVLKKIK